MGGEGQLAIRGDGGGGEEGQIQEAGLSGERPVADDEQVSLRIKCPSHRSGSQVSDGAPVICVGNKSGGQNWKQGRDQRLGWASGISTSTAPVLPHPTPPHPTPPMLEICLYVWTSWCRGNPHAQED